MRAIVSSQRGVTLVELMTVVAIIAIIAAMALALYSDTQKKARLAADRGTLAAMRSAIAIYYGENDGFFPPAIPSGPPMLQAAPSWKCPGGSASYDPAAGIVTYAPNDITAC